MLPYWKNIRVPVIYLLGENDEIVDTSNATVSSNCKCLYLDIKFIRNRHHRLAQFEWPAIRESIMRIYEMVKK